MKSEKYDKMDASSEGGKKSKEARQTMHLVMFACMFLGCVVGTVVISILRNRHRRGATVGVCGRSNRTFVRVDSNPHPLSPEDKHINSLQVNGYYNPIYKFFDDPQDT